MTDFLAYKKRKLLEKNRSKTLCRSGFHKWEILTQGKFDVKQGKLVTAYQCKRCGTKKNTAL